MILVVYDQKADNDKISIENRKISMARNQGGRGGGCCPPGPYEINFFGHRKPIFSGPLPGDKAHGFQFLVGEIFYNHGESKSIQSKLIWSIQEVNISKFSSTMVKIKSFKAGYSGAFEKL